MAGRRFDNISQAEAALAEEIGNPLLELDYSEDGKIIDS